MQLDSQFNCDGSGQGPEVSPGYTLISKVEVSVEFLQGRNNAVESSVVGLVLIEAAVAATDAAVES